MTFEYLDVPQRSPQWFDVRKGRVTASRLADWMAVSVAKGKEGTPLKARADYERELWFERKFGVSFNNFVSDAMLDGQAYEDFAVEQYEAIRGVKADKCGIWYSKEFAASPDRMIYQNGTLVGLLEVKVPRDNKFTEILLGGVPDDHWKQIQGQLLATGLEWCDYVALNLSTRKVALWRVERNPAFQALIEESLAVPLSVEEVSLDEVYSVIGELPARENVGIESVIIETELW